MANVVVVYTKQKIWLLTIQQLDLSVDRCD